MSEIHVKSEDETDPKYGCRPNERPIEEYICKGVVNLDKPAGPTSHQVASWVKKMFELKKVGHSGTLDPKVTGVLPIGLEESTKILQSLLLAGKEYVCLMKLHADASNSQVKKTLSLFQSMIYQRPPVKSAVKRQLRTRTIYSIKYLERQGDYVLYTVECEAGTYIRKLCHDLGLVLGVGAHMQELRRIKSGPFTEENLVTLHDLRDAYEDYRQSGSEDQLRSMIQPMEAAVDHLPKIWLKDTAVDAVCHGATLTAPGVSKHSKDVQEGKMAALLTLKDELAALATSHVDSEKIQAMRKGEVANPIRVVIQADIYPRSWTKKT